jgi:hypothetical protein
VLAKKTKNKPKGEKRMRKLRSSNLTLTRGMSHELETGYSQNFSSRVALDEKVKTIDSRFEVKREYQNLGEVILNVDSQTSFNTNDFNNKWYKVIELLHENDFKATYSHGIHQSGHHIHVDVADLTPVQIANIYTAFYEYQEVICLAIPESRVSDSSSCYVKPIDRYQALEVYKMAKDWKDGRITRTQFLENLSDSSSYKFRILSTNKLLEIGTLEFRAWGQPLLTDLEESKKRFFYNGQFFVSLVNYFARFKGLQKVTKDLPSHRLWTAEDESLEKSKPNRFSKGSPKNFQWTFNTIFRNALECEDNYNHFKARVKKVLSFRRYRNKDEMKDYINSHKW